jgi:hypothetical protein
MTNKTINLVRTFFLVTIMLTITIPTSTVSARLVRCRADPIFYLSNGDKVTVILDIDTDASNVRNVNYVIHVPAGVKITRAVFTAGGIGRKETYQAIQDGSVGVYITETVVTTQGAGGPVAITATSSISGGTSASASGFNGDKLIVTLTQRVEALIK